MPKPSNRAADSGGKTSNAGDLTPFCKEVEALVKRHFGKRAALAIAFTLSPDYDEVHWVTNVSRGDGIRLFAATAARMKAERN